MQLSCSAKLFIPSTINAWKKTAVYFHKKSWKMKEITHDLTFYYCCDPLWLPEDKGPLHVLWQVSFGCWITWSISSCQNPYNRVKLSFWMVKFTVIQKKTTWHLDLAKLMFWSNLSFKNLQDRKVNIFLSFSGER